MVGQAWVASFWPWKYYYVSTVQLHLDDPSEPLSQLARMARGMKLGVSYNEVPPMPDKFITHVHKGDRNQWVKSFDDPLFEREYSNLSEARIGHNEVVELLSKGKLKLSHIRAMSTYFKTLDTNEGQVDVLTKTRWMCFVPMPYTSVTPQKAVDLKRLGTIIKWTTNDPVMLAKLHDAIVRLLEEVGISGLVEIGNIVKMTERVAKPFGRSWRDIVKQAAQDGVSFPVPDDVLRYIKGFM